jgi:hypothetical protein
MSLLKYKCELDLKESIDWQRSNASLFKSLIAHKDHWYQENHCDGWNSYFDDVFNLETANEFGLSVWSIILDESAFGVIQASPPDYPAWGFGEFRKNFGNGNFGTNSDSGYNFTVEQIRIMLRLKAFILHMNGSVHGENVIGINESLVRIFGENKVSCIDNRDMSFTYILYDNSLSGLAIELYNRDLLPRPVGIDINVVINGGIKQWGFGSNRANFGNGNFGAGIIIGN